MNAWSGAGRHLFKMPAPGLLARQLLDTEPLQIQARLDLLNFHSN
jgi:hypothetical protein